MGESRRSFLKTASAAAVQPSSAPRRTVASVSRFAPEGAPRRISENLYVFEDTCNVYLVRQGTHGLLIDFGSGKILDHLPALGITQVDWILHTHHHRDQCQGDLRAVERKIPIAVPQHEREQFEEAENFWRNRRVFHLYNMRNDFNTVTVNIPVARSLADYSTFTWRGLDFFILPTPGHTLGSITLLARIDGKKTAFSGDLMMAPGKVVNLYDLQVTYGGFEGANLGTYAMKYLLEQKAELLCPSNGEPMADPQSAIQETQRRLMDFYRFESGRPGDREHAVRSESAPGGELPDDVIVLRDYQRQRQGDVHRLRVGFAGALLPTLRRPPEWTREFASWSTRSTSCGKVS